MSQNASNQFGNFRALRTNLAERELDQEIGQVTLADAKDTGLAPSPELFLAAARERRFIDSIEEGDFRQHLIAAEAAHLALKAKLASGELVEIRWGHLSNLVERAAIEAFPCKRESWHTDETPVASRLPWNLDNLVHAGLSVEGRYPRYAPAAQAAKVIEGVMHFCRWLRAAAKLPGLRKAIKASQSARGQFARGTVVNLWEAARRCPSPGRLERALWATKARADDLVSSFVPGGHASWRSLFLAVVFHRQTCKSGVVAAAMTLTASPYIRLYRDARNALADLASAKVRDTSDGVAGRRSDTPALVQNGVEVFDLYVQAESRRGPVFGFDKTHLVRRTADGRTFHHDGRGNPEWSVTCAVQAWKRQDDADRVANRGVQLEIGYLKGDFGLCPIFTRRDSTKVGHCSSGTDAWMRAHGWGERDIIFGWELVPYLNDSRIRRIVSYRMRYDVSPDTLAAAA